MNFREFAAALTARWKTFTAVAASVAAAGLTWILLTPVTYVSSAQLLVSVSGSTTAAAYVNEEVARDRVNSYIPLLNSDVVSQRVVDTLHLPQTAHDLAAQVSATRVPPNTSVIDVSVTAGSADQARALAAAFAREFIEYTAALETPTGGDSQKVRVTKISGPTEPRSNTPIRIALGVPATLLAVLVGAVVIWTRSQAAQPQHALPPTKGT